MAHLCLTHELFQHDRYPFISPTPKIRVNEIAPHHALVEECIRNVYRYQRAIRENALQSPFGNAPLNQLWTLCSEKRSQLENLNMSEKKMK